jgi:hypothetical protein
MMGGSELKLTERETCLIMSAADRSCWMIFSDDPVLIKRLESIGATFTHAVGQGRYYSLPASSVTLRKPSTLSQEERERRGARLRKSLGNVESPDNLRGCEGTQGIVVQGQDDAS